MLIVGDIGTKDPAGGIVRQQRRRYGIECFLLASVLLALIESVKAAEYINRDCALNRQVSDDFLSLRYSKTTVYGGIHERSRECYPP